MSETKYDHDFNLDAAQDAALEEKCVKCGTRGHGLTCISRKDMTYICLDCEAELDGTPEETDELDHPDAAHEAHTGRGRSW